MIPKCGITLKDIGNDTTTVSVTQIEHFNKMKAFLENMHAKFYSYTPSHLKNKLQVLKGIKGDFEEHDIMDEINGLELQDVKIIKISKIKLGRHDGAPTHFLVQLSSDSLPNSLTKLDRLACQRIHWEPYRKTKVFQCRNCQRVGHSSTNCRLGYRCVKCLNNHGPGECSVDKNASSAQAACINCGESGHPASYRGCKYLKIAQGLVSTKKTQTKRLQGKKLIRSARWYRLT